MHAWETLNLYCLYDKDFFETSERYAPQAQHLLAYRELMPPTWRLRRRGLWYIADPPQGDMAGQGWKLHVSAPAGRTVEVLHRALPVLRDRGVHFKFLLDPWANHVTSRKSWPRGSSGKFITVYPDADAFEDVGDALAAALDGIEGPYILSDRRYKGSRAVYYRYGGFVGISELLPEGNSSLMIRTPDGELVPDIRHPYPSTPAWVNDPVATADDAGAASGSTMLGDRFTVNAAIIFSNAGGVYRGTDTQTGRDVVIKEARPHVLTGASGAQTIDVLAKEHAILEALSDTGLYVEPTAFLREWEHAFLVEEHLDGEHLGQWSIANNPVCHNDLSAGALRSYYTAAQSLWRQVAAAVAAAHDRGILLGDLSFGNVMVVEDGTRVKLIDLEAAVREGVDEELGIYTSGLASPATVASGRYDRANDLHALGSLMLGSLMVVNNAVGFNRPALERFLTSLSADLALPAELTKLIADLTSGAEHDAHAVLARIDALDFADPRLWTEPVALAQPAGPARAALRARVEEAVGAVSHRIVASADVQRRDRLFPADVEIFETNPLSISHGAMGVLRALQRLTGDVPQDLLGWALTHGVDTEHYAPGLYCGQSGIAWALADLGHPAVANAILDAAGEHPLLFAKPDIMRGCAGYGLARLRMWQLDGGERHLAEARRIGAHLAATAAHDERGAFWPSVGADGEQRTPVGYAYGASGIALFLLYLHQATGDDAPFALGREALAFELEQGVRVNARTRAYPSHASDDPGASPVLRNYWDEGTAGVTTVALRYLAVRPDDEDLRATVTENLSDSARKYANMPQLFHGLAGLGNVLLDAYELSGEQRWLDEAWRTGEGVLHFAVERPDGIAFPGEQALRESSDYATGSAGVGLFLQRLTLAAPGARTNFDLVLDELLPAQPVALGAGAELAGAVA